MRNGQKLALAAGVLGFALATTSLAAQDQKSAPMRPSIMGMMHGMSQMMGTCNKMMQAQRGCAPASAFDHSGSLV